MLSGMLWNQLKTRAPALIADIISSITGRADAFTLSFDDKKRELTLLFTGETSVEPADIAKVLNFTIPTRVDGNSLVITPKENTLEKLRALQDVSTDSDVADTFWQIAFGEDAYKKLLHHLLERWEEQGKDPAYLQAILQIILPHTPEELRAKLLPDSKDEVLRERIERLAAQPDLTALRAYFDNLDLEIDDITRYVGPTLQALLPHVKGNQRDAAESAAAKIETLRAAYEDLLDYLCDALSLKSIRGNGEEAEEDLDVSSDPAHMRLIVTMTAGDASVLARNMRAAGLHFETGNRKGRTFFTLRVTEKNIRALSAASNAMQQAMLKETQDWPEAGKNLSSEPATVLSFEERIRRGRTGNRDSKSPE